MISQNNSIINVLHGESLFFYFRHAKEVILASQGNDKVSDSSNGVQGKQL
jgi:hypothetical protein